MTDLEKKLTEALRETLRSLEAHLQDEATEKNVTVEQLCPCYQNEVVRARAILKEAEAQS